MSLGFFLVEIYTRALQHVLNAEFAPGDEGCVAISLVGKDFDDLAVNSNGAVLVVSDDFAIETAVDRVVLHAVSDVGSGLAGSIDRDDFDIVRLDGSAKCEGADTAETIDTNFNHVYSSS